MPHVGTWIEIIYQVLKRKLYMVVPHVGTWIEISRKTITREAGVVPHVGTWIEINWDQSDIDPIRRASRRHVD